MDTEKNKEVLKGYTKENIKEYAKNDKIFRIENKINNILPWGILIIMMIGAIYYYFFLK